MTREALPVPGILATIGSTPVVELTKLDPISPFRTYAKLEAANPGGSIKDRSALEMLRERIEAGWLVPGRSVIVESSSGNLGIGIAQVCGYHGIRFICVVDPRTNRQNISIMRALGADVEMVTDVDPTTGEYLPVRIRRVRELVATIDGAYCPDQYSNTLNPKAHHTTVREILDALPTLDYLFCAASSCGTLRGCAEHIRAHELPVTIVAVDALGSSIFGPSVGRRLLPGYGAPVRPQLYRDGLADLVVRLEDVDAVVGCRRLAAREAIIAGGSSGAVVSALESMRDEIPAGATCALIFPDRGERYLDTIYDDDWVRSHFGDVSYRWKNAEMDAAPC